MKEVVVIGGGVIGMCTAYYLVKEGHQVTIVDQSTMDFGASYVNAGYISPSHIIPLAAPGVVRQGIKWMFNSASPLYIKPRFDKDFLSWLWAFNKSCSTANVTKSVEAIKDISVLSRDLFAEIKQEERFPFHMEQKGLLVLCRTNAMLEKELKVVKMAQEEGLEAKEVSLEGLKQLEPEVTLDVKGASIYYCDWHSTPHEFMQDMKTYLEANGVRFLRQERIVDLVFKDNNISELITEQRRLKADVFVMAAGSWSQRLAKKLGVNIRLQAGKGYRINSTRPVGIRMPAILAENKVAVTPMNGFTRFAGTMEIAGINHNIRKERVEAIANSVQLYYPDVKITEQEKQEAACGLRPVSPDGRPYIGKSKKCNNLVIATGHAMMGWSMAPGTGKLVSELISEKKTSIGLEAFHPDRAF